MTQAGTALGSPRYMSPEQVLGQAIDARSDIFSLGVVLYEMLTKRTPFEQPEDTTVFALMNRIAGTQHKPLRQHDPSIPQAFEHIVDKALAKRADDRYQRAGEMAQDLRDYRNLQPGAPRPAPAPTQWDKTMVVGTAAPATPRPPEDEKVRTQLITDLDKFVEQYDREESERVKAAEDALKKKEEEVRRWGEEQAKKRAELEQQQQAALAAASDTSKRRGALDLLKKQAAAQPQRESPALVRMKQVAAMDATMRNAFQYLAELEKELNSVTPSAQQPYEFIYLGKLPAVMLSQAFVDSRPIRLDGKDVCQQLIMRYRIMPSQPARANLLGEDIGRCEQYLQFMKVPFQQRPLAKNDFGKVTRAEITVTGSLPCEIIARADYDNFTINIELTNVRRLGRMQYRLSQPQFDDAVDDLARYMLGADDDFEKAARGGK